MQNVIRESNYYKSLKPPPWRGWEKSCQVTPEMSAVGKIKDKGTAQKRCILVDQVVFHRNIGQQSEITYMYTGVEQLSKWILDAGSQVSHCWKERLQTS